ncbi:hypothetical protein ABZS77_26955 [Micromonospora sp. NPDC005298]|uniref:hypothetical protein n=1 Tax=Micromonospora sp. NPDC005298 TaxID=3156873 RepID=UPI0033B46E1E
MPELPPIDTFERLTANIRGEIVAMNVPMNLKLDDATLGNLAESIAINITYAFDVEWAPKWVEAGQPHRWQEDHPGGTTYHVECLACGAVFRDASTEAVEGSYHDHQRRLHAQDPTDSDASV